MKTIENLTIKLDNLHAVLSKEIENILSTGKPSGAYHADDMNRIIDETKSIMKYVASTKDGSSLKYSYITYMCASVATLAMQILSVMETEVTENA